jgi:hypothetical protein
MAVFIGIGFTSMNSLSIRSRYFKWISVALLKSPSRHNFTIFTISFGMMLDVTHMTPLPPIAMSGTVSSSLPLQKNSSLPHAASVVPINLKLPDASFTPLMFGCFDNSMYVSVVNDIPVRLGTLYKIIGRWTLSATKL